MSTKQLIIDAAEECGWGEDTQIDVLCDFISQMNYGEPNFERYLQNRVFEELDSDDEVNTTTCHECGQDFPDEDMIIFDHLEEGEFCQKCARQMEV